MALILLKANYTQGGSFDYRGQGFPTPTNPYNGSAGVWWHREAWEFNTDTEQVQYTNSQNYYGQRTSPTADPPPSNVSTQGVFHSYCLPASTTRREFTHNGSGGFTSAETANSVSCGYGTLLLTLKDKKDVTTPGGNDSIIQLEAKGGVAPYRYRLPPAQFGDVDVNVYAGLPAGGYTFEAQDAAGQVVSLQVTVTQPAEVIYGCTDPLATNYDPSATNDNNTCIYPPKLEASFPYPVTVAGNPIEVVLESGPNGASAAAVKASALITLGALTAESRLTVNGHPFTFELTPQAGEFNNGESLVQALLDEELITLRYSVSQPSFNQVRLEALVPGSMFTPEVTATGGVSFEVTAGKDLLRSHALRDWGCYVEIWACQGIYGSEVDKGTGVMLERLERLRLPENSYRFDLAPTLGRKLRRSLFSEGGVLQAYFVRYGEVYAPNGQTQRRRFPIADSAVYWALDGALPLTELNHVHTVKLLNTMPQRITIPLHGMLHAEALYILATTGTITLAADFTAFDGTVTQEDVTTLPVETGGVKKVPLHPVFARAVELDALKHLLSVKVTASLQVGAAVTVLGEYTVFFEKQAENQHCLVFATTQGAYDTYWFTGLPETKFKRSADTFSRGLPAVRTSSSRSTVTRSVALENTQLLNSALLDKGTFEWLTSERGLAGSPDVYLYDPYTNQYQAVGVVDIDAKADELEQEYYITVALEKGLPANTLSN